MYMDDEGYNNIGDKGMRGICKNLKKVNNLNMSKL
jgi:hypothetical protein